VRVWQAWPARPSCTRRGSEKVAGFTIDQGFQVLNTAYPALNATVDLGRLDLRRLPRGVRVRKNGELHAVRHPLTGPGATLGALTSSVVGLRSKLALARYAAGCAVGSRGSIKRRVDLEAREAWAHLPVEVVDNLLTPFFAGVVLEEQITTSRVFTDMMMGMFILGSSAVPAAGMQALPEELAQRLPLGTVQLEREVSQVSSDGVTLVDGSVVDASAVVVAVDPWTAHSLVPELGTPPAARGVTTYYFAVPQWSDADPLLTVDVDRSGVTNSVVLTASVPEYSSDGRALIATSVLHVGSVPVLGAEAAQAVAIELHQAPNSDWELVATKNIPNALPAMTAPHRLRNSVEVAERLWVAGDHRDTSSIQGALVSGRRTAALVLAALGGNDEGQRNDEGTAQ
jgi:hypothetical protein